MDLQRARHIVETHSPETVNQYLRFGWKLVNQHVIEAREGHPPKVKYVLASFRALEDTKRLITLSDVAQINEYLDLGWRLIEKYVTQSAPEGPRHEQVHFVLAWSHDEPPKLPGMGAAQAVVRDPKMFDDLGDFSALPPLREADL
jgi:hypothetical protein